MPNFKEAYFSNTSFSRHMISLASWLTQAVRWSMPNVIDVASSRWVDMSSLIKLSAMCGRFIVKFSSMFWQATQSGLQFGRKHCMLIKKKNNKMLNIKLCSNVCYPINSQRLLVHCRLSTQGQLAKCTWYQWRQWCSEAGKVTDDLAENNDSLLQRLWLTSSVGSLPGYQGSTPATTVCLDIRDVYQPLQFAWISGIYTSHYSCQDYGNLYLCNASNCTIYLFHQQNLTKVTFSYWLHETWYVAYLAQVTTTRQYELHPTSTIHNKMLRVHKSTNCTLPKICWQSGIFIPSTFCQRKWHFLLDLAFHICYHLHFQSL